MQLILAIDADQRQVGQLASLVRGRLNAELIQADSAGEALQVLGERVPDLIMTSRLLSPFDEGVLAEYLREMGPAAAHVQTLHIPVFGFAKPAGERSLFSFGRKRKAEPATEGCDPNLFAEEIALYLARAAEERQNLDGTERGTFDPAPIAETDDTPATYVPAYEPDGYVARPAAGDSSNFACQLDETLVYETPVAPAASERHIDLEPAAASMYDDTIEDDGVEPFTYRVEEIALGEPEYPDTTSSVSELVSEPQHATAHVEEARADEQYEEPVAYIQPAPVWRRSETFEPDATVPLNPDTTSCTPEPVRLEPDTTSYTPEPVRLEPDTTYVEEEGADELHDVASLVDQEQSGPLPVIEYVAMSEEELEADARIDLDPSIEAHEAIVYTAPQVEDELRDAAPVDTIEPIAEPPDTVAYSEPRPAVEASLAVEAVATEPGPMAADEGPAAPEGTVEKHSIESVGAKASSAARGRHRRSPSFESALALIRKAWKKSDSPATQEPAAQPTPAQNGEPAASEVPAVAAAAAVQAEPEVPAVDPSVVAAPVPSAPVAAEATPQLRASGDPTEVDLTCDIDALEDPALKDAQFTVVETPAPDDDVYELSASPVLHDLDADIAAAAPPRVVRQSLPETEPAAAAQAETHKRTTGRKAAADQKRKRADKRKAPPQDAKRNNNRPVQDEWGLFDPNRCGFAAVVEKLNEVTEEDPKAPQTSVRVISYK